MQTADQKFYSADLRKTWKKLTPEEYASVYESLGDHTAAVVPDHGDMMVHVLLSGELVTLLPNWIRERGGKITARDLCKNRRDVKTADDAERWLMELVSRGIGHWESKGRSRVYAI